MIKRTLVVLLILAVSSGAFAGGKTKTVEIEADGKIYVLLEKAGTHRTRQQMQIEAMQDFMRAGEVLGTVPAKFSLQEFATPIKDQGRRGTCVAFATVGLIEILENKKFGKKLDLSEQYIYWASKALLDRFPNTDGSTPADMMAATNIYGVPAESVWAYESAPWFMDAKNHKDCVASYKSDAENVPTECLTNGEPPAGIEGVPKIFTTAPTTVSVTQTAIISRLLKGQPVEIGVPVYKHAWGFDNPKSLTFKSGTILNPTADDETVGGHAIVIVGYDKESARYIIRNSWGTTAWGSTNSYGAGYGTIPMEYVQKYALAATVDLN